MSPRPQRPPAPGTWALTLAALIVLASALAFSADLALTHADPFELQLWAVHPFVIVVATGLALLVPLVLAVVAIRRQGDAAFGIGALVLAGIPEVIALAIVVLVVANALT
jgi:hypothetical protein